SIAQNTTYTDQGATAFDAFDGNVSVTTSGDVDSSTIGNYSIVYQATDNSGNNTTLTRVINVLDKTEPVITLNGESDITLIQGHSYLELGASAMDNYDTSITVSLTGEIDSSVIGIQQIIYSATDVAGNQSTLSRFITVLDNTAPVISLNGATQISIPQNTIYTEQGATALDNVDGNIIPSLSGLVDTSAIGTYSIVYSATDSAGNTATLSRSITVLDKTAPVITIIGLSNVSITQNFSYQELGATAVDDYDGSITPVITGTVDTSIIGHYTVLYSATDSAGNQALVYRSIEVVKAADTLKPEINLNGVAEIYLEVGDTYNELGATVIDEVDGEIDVVITGQVNNQVVDSYTLTYSAADEAGNQSVEKTRIVYVVDSSAPVLTLNGESEITLEVNTLYQEKGATVMDNYSVIVHVVIEMDLDNTTLGQYIVTYQASDEAGNAANEVTRIVNVVDETEPQLVLIGESSVSLFVGEVYFELGATVTDNYDSSLQIDVLGSVDSQIKGIYTITYLTMDSSGNRGEITREVIMLEDLSPQIILNGEEYMTMYQGDTYIELNAVASDEKDGELLVGIEGSVNPQITGQYEIIYSATDSNNQQVDVSRWVTVLPDVFTTLWNSEHPGQGTGSQITLEINPDFTYDYNVDWGDGQTDSNVTANITHTYSQPGEYLIQISGVYPQMYFDTQHSFLTDNQKLLSVEHWGDNVWLSMNKAFYYTKNMVINASDAPDLSMVKDMYCMFCGARSFNQSIGHWDVSKVTNMNSMFSNAIIFNQDISNWDLSSVTDTSNMFSYAYKFNQNIGGWEMSLVENMDNMFEVAQSFDQNINDWDVSKVESMESMFIETTFNQPLFSWDVSSVKNMGYMFKDARIFNQDINSWTVGAVENMERMFEGANVFNQPLNNWDVSLVTNMESMFNWAYVFNQNINDWDVSKVTNMFYMFGYATEFNQDLSGWQVLDVTNMVGMFYHATDFNQNINSWNVSKVEGMYDMFREATSFNQPLNSWNVSAVETMYAMFHNASNFNQDLSNWNVTSVTSFGGQGTYPRGMFEGASNFDQDLSGWDITGVTEMVQMFKDTKLSTINYDKLLISWSNQLPQSNVLFDGGDSEYTPNSLAQIARTYLIDDLGWIITDGGAAVID
ncbi:MAG: BspA family leucine-rich repeat surface protein, partial [Saccharospirillaceae bacterium]|nr:BspA family leucine-rich repeat surface protein [Saccharospirillaceae bacterium]